MLEQNQVFQTLYPIGKKHINERYLTNYTYNKLNDFH